MCWSGRERGGPGWQVGEPERYTGPLKEDPGQEACRQGLSRSWEAREEPQSPLGSFHKGKGSQAQVSKPTEAGPEKSGPWLASSPELCCPHLPSPAASLGLLGTLSRSLCHLGFPLCEAGSKKIHRN